MTTRRGRDSHVRPRPPSSGRPLEPVRAAAPAPHRIRQHRGLSGRRQTFPAPTRLLLALSVLVLAGATFLAASDRIGLLAGSLGSAFTGAFDRLIATPQPSATEIIATGAPIIASPAQAYTNQKSVSLDITLPADAVGDPNATVRIYLALTGLKPAPIGEVPVAATVRMSVPVDLTKGRNDFSATIVRDGVESDPSPSVTYVLDQDPPRIKILSPKDGATISDPAATIRGSTQAGTTLVVRNDANTTSITISAAADGSFTVVLPLDAGPNTIHIAATDPAGNTNQIQMTILEGTGKMSASLTASVYRISVSHHPSSLQLTVTVTNQSGAPVAGDTAFFTLQIPGLAPISGSLTTGADGRAVFTTPLVGSLQTGNGLATVLVTDPTLGQTTARTTLTFVA